jgi:uncharacterized protein YciI
MTVPALPTGTYQVLSYDYVADILDRRDPYRPAHLEHALAARRRGELVNIGAVGTPPVGALLVFVDLPAAEVEAYAQADPYLLAGLVTGYRVQPWTVVV